MRFPRLQLLRRHWRRGVLLLVGLAMLLGFVLFQRTRSSPKAATLITILRTNSVTGGSEFSEFRIIERAFREAGVEARRFALSSSGG